MTAVGASAPRAGPAQRIPNLYIAGVPKAGTTTLARWLIDHPEVAGGVDKELRFLMDRGDTLARRPGYQELGLAGYPRLFPESASRATFLLDASPQYYYQETARRVLAGLKGRPQVLFVFRNPARRLYSLFRFAQNNQAVLSPSLSFPAFLEEVRGGSYHHLRGRPMLQNALRHSDYASYVERWLEALPREDLHFLVFEELVRDPRAVMDRLARALGLPVDFYASYDFPVENETYGVRSRWLHRLSRGLHARLPLAGIRRRIKAAYFRLNTRAPESSPRPQELPSLRELDRDFAEANRRLERLTGLDLSAWRPR